MTLAITHDKDRGQFVAIVDGKTATLKYSILADEKILDYYSTFVPSELQGRQIGQELAKFALDFAADNGYQVIPTCSFIEQFIKRHPEYKKLVAS
ncbi:MAG: N-acetyltransferase [Alphaproteobacteria bacterium]|jgi:predicted GNAT family acetyltransferase|nr:N-acetyltransferase [Alphaproteobacteria bacterium]MBP9777220.1 N-acetyltransferase [Alphaproteobacteria bacterium]